MMINIEDQALNIGIDIDSLDLRNTVDERFNMTRQRDCVRFSYTLKKVLLEIVVLYYINYQLCMYS